MQGASLACFDCKVLRRDGTGGASPFCRRLDWAGWFTDYASLRGSPGEIAADDELVVAAAAAAPPSRRELASSSTLGSMHRPCPKYSRKESAVQRSRAVSKAKPAGRYRAVADYTSG